MAKGNALGYEPRAKNENKTRRGVILYPHYSINGQGEEIEYTPDKATAAEFCDLKARIWNTRGELARLEMALETYGETPTIPRTIIPIDYIRDKHER